MADCNDSSLVPASSCRDTDFTVAFEQLVLSFVPNALFLVFAALHLPHLVHKARIVATGRLSTALEVVKSVVSLALLALCVAIAATWPDHHWTSILSFVFATLAAGIAVPLIALEHARLAASSYLPALWLGCTIGCDIVRVRTAVSIDRALPTRLLAAQLGLRCSLFILNELSKKLKPECVAVLGMTEAAPPLSRLLVAWLNPFVFHGMRRRLELKDIPPVSQDLSPAVLWTRFEPHFAPSSRHPLYRALNKGLGDRLLAPLPIVLLAGALIGVQPLLIQGLVAFLASYKTEQPQSATWGWLLAVGSLLLTGGYAIAISRVQSYSAVTVAAVRGALIQAVYEKSLRVHGSVALEQGTGLAAALMSTDVERITEVATKTYSMILPVVPQLVVTIVRQNL